MYDNQEADYGWYEVPYILTLILVFLKLGGFISVSWWAVLTPALVVAVPTVIIVLIGMLAMAYVMIRNRFM